MDGQERGGRGMAANLLQPGCPLSTSKAGGQVGLRDARGITTAMQRMFVQPGAVAAFQAQSRASTPDATHRASFTENRGTLTGNSPEVLMSVPKKQAQRAQPQGSIMVGGGPQGIVVPAPIATGIPAPQQVPRKALAMVGQAASCLDRTGNRRTSRTVPYPVRMYATDLRQSGALQKAGIQGQSSDLPVAAAVQRLGHPLPMKPEHMGRVAAIRANSHIHHLPAQAPNGHMKMMQLCRAPQSSEGLHSSKFACKPDSFLVQDEAGVYQLVERPENVGQLGVSPLKPGSTSQRVYHNKGRPLSGEENHGNDGQAQCTPSASRNIPDLQSTTWDPPRTPYHGHHQRIQNLPNLQQHHSNSVVGPSVAPNRQHEPGFQSGTAPLDQSQVLGGCTTVSDNIKVAGGVVNNCEDHTPILQSSPEPGDSPPDSDCVAGRTPEADLLTAAQSLKDLSHNGPRNKPAQGTSTITPFDDECGNQTECGRLGDDDGAGWNRLDLLLDAATRASYNIALDACPEWGGKRSAPLAESTTRLRDKKTRGMGVFKWPRSRCRVQDPFESEESPATSFYATMEYRGVTPTKSGKFIARCRYKGSAVRIGIFDCAYAASKAYDRFILGIRGHRATTNHPRQEYLDFEIGNAKSAFKAKVLDGIRKPSTGPWLRALANLWEGGENQLHDFGDPSTASSFERHVQKAVHVMAPLKQKSPGVFQEAVDRIQYQRRAQESALFKTVAEPFTLLKKLGEKGLSLEDALAVLEREIKQLPQIEIDNSPSDPLLCAADILRSLIAVWKSWGGKGDACRMQDVELNVNSGRSSSSCHATKPHGDAEVAEERIACGEESRRSSSRRTVAASTSRGNVLSPEGLHHRSPQPLVSDFMHLLANDVNNCEEESHLNLGRSSQEFRGPGVEEDSLSFDRSSNPSSCHTGSGGRNMAHTTHGPVVVSGGRVRGRRPAPRRGSGRNVAFGRTCSVGGSLSKADSDTTENRSASKRRKVSVSPKIKLYTDTAITAIEERHQQEDIQENTADEIPQICADAHNEMHIEESRNSDMPNSNCEGKECAEDVNISVEARNVKVTGSDDMPASSVRSENEDCINTPPSVEAVAMDKKQAGQSGRLEEKGQDSCGNSTSKHGGTRVFRNEVMADFVESIEKEDTHTPASELTPPCAGLLHAGQPVFTPMQVDLNNKEEVEQGIVMVYGNQLAVQPAEEEDQSKVESENSDVNSIEGDDQLEAMVDSVQWLRLLASSLWPKKRGGGMLHKAFVPHCAGSRHRELTLKLREHLCSSSSRDSVTYNGLQR